jgi:periplasmic divalent cation tolerance protein
VENIQVFTSTATKDDARTIAQMLVKERLAACVQIVGPILSTYRWKSKVVTEEEWLCFIKTHTTFYKPLESAIKAVHPYETPEIIALPIINGSRDYLEWLNKSLKKH